MASVLDQFAGVAAETTYGTAVAPTRSYEVTEDSFSRETEQLTSVGFRAGKQAQLGDRRRQIDLGATGSLAGAMTTKGMGLLLKGLLGESTDPAAQQSTTAYEQTFTSATAGPSESYTIQIGRADSAGNIQRFVYAGCTATAFNFACASGAELTYRIDYSASSETTTSTTTAPVYVASNEMFIYSDITLEIDGNTTNAVSSFSFDADLAMEVDRRFLRGNAQRLQPLRSGEPSFTGTLNAEFADLTLYNLYATADTFELKITARTSDAIATSTGVNATTYYPTWEIFCPNVRFDGSTPAASPTDLTGIDLPFTVVYDGSNDAVQMTYVSTDTTA